VQGEAENYFTVRNCY